MDQDLLECLLFAPEIEKEKVKILLDIYGTEYMTVRIAENLNSLTDFVNVKLFDAAWKLLDENGKRSLMLNNLSILDAKKFESCFLDLSRWFPGFSDRSRKHDVELQNTEDNYKLAERLKAVSYITSYILKGKEIFDTVTETKIKRKILSCKIKKCSG